MKDQSDNILYTGFDFHVIVGRENYDRLNVLTHPLKDVFESYGFFLYSHERRKILRIQNAVFRTNCLDCLDRTNVVQL